ncbi:hypothetical protein ACYRFS_02675 [Listeria kieliensis]
MKNEFIQYGKYILYLIICVAIIYLVSILLEKLMLLFLEKINDKRTYNTEKLLKKLLKSKGREYKFLRDPKTGQTYFSLSYWVWQKNKFNVLTDLSPKNSILKGTDCQVYQTGSYCVENKRGKSRRYKREFRVYFV